MPAGINPTGTMFRSSGSAGNRDELFRGEVAAGVSVSRLVGVFRHIRQCSLHLFPGNRAAGIGINRGEVHCLRERRGGER